ncbi:MAG: biotin carboxylase N-terminal domain-containing protein [Candidatus Eisenbacteria bacterium]
MFKRVLIANRGEIACRIAATLREMGIAPIAVCSAADRGALHTRVAADCIEIGPAEPRASYLDAAKLIEAAKRAGAGAIHPGYGFLSENAAFAAAVEAAGLTFIGPTADAIRAMGDKRSARDLAVESGVPVVPGATGANADALAIAARGMGYPVMVKAALGGGGKGMRAVADEAGLRDAVESAQRLAASAFGDDSVYLEKQLARPRHIEVQVLGDGRGHAIHLFERECSLQRRHQKVIEECPSSAVDETLRERITQAAVGLAKHARYRGAGTMEFLLAPDGAFHFLEMNTRLQVEHPVTEMVTGVDLVRAQVEIAATGALPFAQSDVTRRGHAIEGRVYAEDAARNFLPQAGRATRVRWASAPFVRVDAGIQSGDEVPVHYDPILAKVIALGETRARALDRLGAALGDCIIHGVVTNLPFLRALVHAREVQRGDFDTEWIDREFLAGFAALATAPAPERVLAAAALAEILAPTAMRARAPGIATAGGVVQSTVSDDSPGAAAFAAVGRWRQPGLD